MYAIFSTLDLNRLHDLPGVGGPNPCGASFDCEAEAIAFAAQLVREFWCERGIGVLPDGELLSLFQNSLSDEEHFHVVPLVSIPVAVG